MIAARLIAAALLLTVGPAAFAAAKAPAAPRLDGRILRVGCRQGECQWLRVRRADVVKRIPEGRLVRVSGRLGSSTYADMDAPSRADGAKITWQPRDETEYAFCSTRRPAIAFADGRRFLVHFLDLFSLPGFMQPSATLYMRICHDRAGEPGERALRSLGYRAGTRSGQLEVAGVSAMEGAWRR